MLVCQFVRILVSLRVCTSQYFLHHPLVIFKSILSFPILCDYVSGCDVLHSQECYLKYLIIARVTNKEKTHNCISECEMCNLHCGLLSMCVLPVWVLTCSTLII